MLLGLHPCTGIPRYIQNGDHPEILCGLRVALENELKHSADSTLVDNSASACGKSGETGDGPLRPDRLHKFQQSVALGDFPGLGEKPMLVA